MFYSLRIFEQPYYNGIPVDKIKNCKKTRILTVDSFFNKWNNDIPKDTIIQAMFSMEIMDIRIMPCKFSLAVDERIAISKEPPTVSLIFFCEIIKKMLFHLSEMPDYVFRNSKLRFSISRRLELIKGSHFENILEF